MTDAELVKSKIDIVSFINEYVPLKKTGRNFKANCPFHSEKTPSFIVSPERGSWHCFGACNEGGDAISFLQKWENIEFLEALKILAKRTGISLSSYTPTQELRLKEKLYEINHLASEFFHYILTSHKLGEKARQYLKDRGIKDRIIKTFVLGYAPNSWDSLLRFLTKKGYSAHDIYTAGILVKSERGNFYDRFRGRLTFTLKNHRGNIVGFAGRKLPDQEKKDKSIDKQGAKYINTPETPIYIKGQTLYGLDITKEAIKKEGHAVIVEGEFDMLSSFQSGVTNVVAIKGSAITEGQVMMLKRFTENLVLALDSDFAGNEAARRGIEIAGALGLSVKMVKLLSGKDPAECIKEGIHFWKKSVKNAIPIYDFIISTTLEKYDKKDISDKKKIGDEVIPFLSKITNPIVQSHYAKYLARELEVTEESIQLLIRKSSQKQKPSPKGKTVKTHHLRHELLEEYLLSLIVQSISPAESFAVISKILTLDDFSLLPARKIIEQLGRYFKKHKKLKVNEFVASLSPEIIPTFDRVLLKDLEPLLSQEQLLAKELEKTAKEVRKISLRRKVNSLSTKIKEAEKEKSEKKAQKLNEELRRLLYQIKELDKSI